MPGPGGYGPGGPGRYPGGPVGPGGASDPNAPHEPVSHVDLELTDDQLKITVDVTWAEEVYRTAVRPRMMGVVNQLKGKMAVFSAESGPHVLAQAGPRALGTPQGTPRGTWNRAKTDPDRIGLDYPPVQRVSFFADLLPYLGRGSLGSQVNKNAAWYADKNLEVGGAWVPELLVPTYPQSAWRATTPYAPDAVFGATNYVGISGAGLDSARYDPKDPAVKTKLGMTGYGWGSKAEEVTDGLANTIYLMQTPPGLQQPWIAGGGATVRGLDENDPMAGFRYNQGGKPGTFALMGDGSVRFIPATIDKKVLLGMSTRAGGEALADIDVRAPRVDAPKPTTTDLKSNPVTPVVPAPVVTPKADDKKPDDKKGDDKKSDDKKPEDKKSDDKKAEPMPKAEGTKPDDKKGDDKKPDDKK
ncbi:DUF1559 domain-containing protein [Gemmata sp. SH-PL17]|uniref:DUF1559 family PulG-like putative transporter n=1 Tax=Gemmata sp. SH-PL17 TaxID=1630693 RepID=UPI0009ED259A|nr:DUF1559 domain-containing protein [Gemmata sp. SH-PL17]